MKTSKWYFAAASALAAIVASAVPAQAEGPETAVAGTDVEELLITARRRTENLREIPDAITVFDAGLIDRADVARLNDVAALTPNLRFSDDQEVGVGTITVRGVTQQRGIGETPVAFVVDGVAINNSLITTQDLFDVQQIEVLRGPQGALYGRNSIAGAVNIVTRPPTDTLQASVDARLAEGNDTTLRGAVSGPLGSDRVLGRLAVYRRDSDGQLDNDGLGEKVDFRDAMSVRGRLLLAATDRLDLDLRYQYADQRGGSGYFVPGTIDNETNRLPGDTFPFPLENTTFTIQSNLLGESNVAFADYAARLDYRFDGFTLTSITGYNDLRSNNDQDLDQTDREFLNILVNDDATHFSQELRLVSRPEAPLRWIAGAYFSDQERDRSLATFLNVAGFGNGGDWSSQSAFFVPQAPAILNEVYETRALFGQASVDLSDRVELTVAGRWDDVSRKNDTSNPAANGKRSFSELQPKVQLGYTVNDGLRLFATYAEGFRPGGFNTLANDPAVQFGTTFDSEHLKNYELGLKFAGLGGRALVNAALFYIDYTDQQYFLFDPFGSQALINATESEILGGELEAVFKPTNRLTLGLSYGFIDSEIEAIDQVPGLTVPASDVVGNEVPGAPVSSANLSVEYRRPAGSLEWFARVDGERRGKTWFTIDNRNVQNAYSIVDLRVGLDGERWSASVFADNLLDEDWIEYYFSRRFIGLRTDIAWPSPPRQIGVRGSYRF